MKLDKLYSTHELEGVSFITTSHNNYASLIVAKSGIYYLIPSITTLSKIMELHSGTKVTVGINPNASLMAIGVDKKISILTSSFKETHVVTLSSPITYLKLLPESMLIGTTNSHIFFWNFGNSDLTLKEIPAKPSCIDYNKNLTRVILGLENGNLQIYNLTTKEYLATVSICDKKIIDCLFSRILDLLAITCEDNTLRVIDATTWQHKFVYNLNTYPLDIAFLNSKNSILVADDKANLINIDMKTFKPSTIKLPNKYDIVSLTNFAILGYSKETGLEYLTLDNQFNFLYRIGYPYGISAIAFSPNNSHITVSHFDGLIRKWNIKTFNLEVETSPSTNKVNDMEYSPDGNYIALGTNTGELILLKSDSLKEVARKKFETSIERLAFHPELKLLGIALYNGVVILVDIPSLEVKTSEKVSDLPLFALDFSSDGKFIAVGGKERKVWIMLANSLRYVTELESDYTITRLKFSKDAKYLIFSDDHGYIRVWNTITWDYIASLKGHDDTIEAFDIDFKGNFIISGGWDKYNVIWYTKNWKEVKRIKHHISRITDIQFSKTTNDVAIASADSTMSIWDSESWQHKKTLKGHAGWVNTVAFNPKATLLASGGYDAEIKIWDVYTTTEKASISAHRYSVISLLFTPDGQYLISAGYDQTIRITNTSDFSEVIILKIKSRPFDLAISPNGKHLAVAQEDRNVSIWNTASWQPVKILQKHSNPVSTVVYSPCGKYLASGSRDNTVTIWDTTSYSVKVVLKGHKDWIKSIAFSPDGRQLAIASGDKTISIWSTSDWKTIKVIGGLEGPVWIEYSPDNIFLYVADKNTIRVLSLRTWQWADNLEGHKELISSFTFSTDAALLASAGHDNSIIIWTR